MAIYIPVPDPENQYESRLNPHRTGVIRENTRIGIYQTLFDKINSLPTNLFTVFDELVMQTSILYPLWKDTKNDFRFVQVIDNNEGCINIEPLRRSIKYKIRPDNTGYTNPNNLFTHRTTNREDHPGDNWFWENISDVGTANLIIEDIENSI